MAGCSERRQAAQAKPANPPVYAEIVAAPPPPAFIPPAELQVAAPLLAESRLAPPTTSRFPDKAANRATLVSEQSVSTFSVDVDTAAYSFMRRSLAEGALPPPEAVRVEELVNYFPYQYPAPAKRDEPFAVTTTVMPSPWNDKRQLVHIALRGYDVQSAQRPKLNLVLLVDVSGSMAGPDRLPLLQEAFKLFAQQLRDDDRVAIVTYASGTGVALPPTSGRDKQVIIDAIGALGAGGSTAGEEGLQLAYSLAQKHFDSKAVNRVILATDGDFNVGITDPKQLERFIVDKRKTGIYLSVFGVGLDNLNDDLMQRLSQSGN
ncbi:MAG: vWA domain-containing protein, partial [Gammaproteobacteria bacterium]